MSTVDDFCWWEAALAGQRQAIDANEPQTGYFKTKVRKDGDYLPVAFWRKDGVLRCRLGGVEVAPDRAVELWPYAANRPVSYEDYRARVETGKWPGEHAAVIGHNQSPPDNSIEALTERITDLAREADKMIAAGAATDDATANQASDLANLLGELERRTGDLHGAEKRPLLEAGRAVDKKWFALRDLAASLKTRLKFVVVTPWLTKKEAATAKAAAVAIASGASAESVATPKITAGESKRATALRTYHRAELEDRAKLLDHLKDHPDVIACIQKIANDAAKKQITLPGCKIVAERRAA